MSNPAPELRVTADHPLKGLLDDLAARKSTDFDLDLAWYASHRKWPLWAFRGAGTVLIVASISLPFVVKASFKHQESWVAALSLLIALLTSLNSFYQWQGTWQSRTITHRRLKELESRWRIEMVGAIHDPDHDRARTQAQDATKRLLSEGFAVTTGETKSFFNGIRFPK